jgi:hypothetical protein
MGTSDDEQLDIRIVGNEVTKADMKVEESIFELFGTRM